MYIHWWFFLQVVGTPNHSMIIIKLFSITGGESFTRWLAPFAPRAVSCSEGPQAMSCSQGPQVMSCFQGPQAVSCSQGPRAVSCSQGPQVMSCFQGPRAMSCSQGPWASLWPPTAGPWLPTAFCSSLRLARGGPRPGVKEATW